MVVLCPPRPCFVGLGGPLTGSGKMVVCVWPPSPEGCSPASKWRQGSRSSMSCGTATAAEIDYHFWLFYALLLLRPRLWLLWRHALADLRDTFACCRQSPIHYPLLLLIDPDSRSIAQQDANRKVMGIKVFCVLLLPYLFLITRTRHLTLTITNACIQSTPQNFLCLSDATVPGCRLSVVCLGHGENGDGVSKKV